MERGREISECEEQFEAHRNVTPRRDGRLNGVIRTNSGSRHRFVVPPTANVVVPKRTTDDRLGLVTSTPAVRMEPDTDSPHPR